MKPDQTVFCIVESPGAREALAILAASIGLKAEVYGSIDECLSQMDRDRSGCFVLDLPAARGAEPLEALAERGVGHPIIAIVGPGQKVADDLQAAAFDIVEKPFRPEVLVGCIQRAVRCDAEMRVGFQAVCNKASGPGRASR